MSHEWWIGTPPAETAVACGPNQHRLRWEAGRLHAVDHTDPGVEAVLAGLGGGEPPCLAVCRYWAAHTGDARVLSLAGRHPGDTLGVTAADVTRVRALLHQDNLRLRGLARRGGGGSRADQARIQANEHHLGLVTLLAVDPSIGRRLQAEVAHHLAASEPPGAAASPGHRVVLEAATVGRLTPIARRWSGGDRPLRIELGDDPTVRPDRSELAVTVRPTWLSEIWGRYLGVVDHFLVLDVHRIVEDRAEVTGIAAPDGEPARLVLRGPAPWHVERRRDSLA